MNPAHFIAERHAQWRELEQLVQRARRAPAAMAAGEIDQMGALYRHATADLALAQRQYPRHRVTVYLNHLVARSHVAIYRERPLAWQTFADFYRSGYPRLYRSLLPWTSVSFLLFAAAAVAAFFLVWQDPERLPVMMGEEVRSLMEQVEAGDLWTEIAPNARSAASSLILTNNIRVMFLTFAGGMTAGLLTLWVLVSNGLNLGGIFGLLQAHGLAAGLADFVVAHGFIELSVIFLAGGCGLAMGNALVRPGLRSRRDALLAAARRGALLMLGSVPLLVLAGLIEGFISPSGLPFWLKLGLGLATGLALHGYWLFAARTQNVDEDPISGWE